jgi:hypothetical protein
MSHPATAKSQKASTLEMLQQAMNYTFHPAIVGMQCIDCAVNTVEGSCRLLDVDVLCSVCKVITKVTA